MVDTQENVSNNLGNQTNLETQNGQIETLGRLKQSKSLENLREQQNLRMGQNVELQNGQIETFGRLQQLKSLENLRQQQNLRTKQNVGLQNGQIETFGRLQQSKSLEILRQQQNLRMRQNIELQNGQIETLGRLKQSKSLENLRQQNLKIKQNIELENPVSTLRNQNIQLGRQNDQNQKVYLENLRQALILANQNSNQIRNRDSNRANTLANQNQSVKQNQNSNRGENQATLSKINVATSQERSEFVSENLDTLLALARINENQRRSSAKKANENVSKHSLKKDSTTSTSGSEEDVETFDPKTKTQREEFYTKFARIIQNSEQNYRTDKNLNESTSILESRVQSQNRYQNLALENYELQSKAFQNALLRNSALQNSLLLNSNLQNSDSQNTNNPNSNPNLENSLSETASPKKPASPIDVQRFGKPVDDNAAFFAPYKNHPLFNYIKNGHSFNKENLIEYRGVDPNSTKPPRETVTLILKPMARAIAGLEGKAMAMPLARAIVERGTNTDILFEPDAVAIVGPGGIAHAQSELDIGYVD